MATARPAPLRSLAISERCLVANAFSPPSDCKGYLVVKPGEVVYVMYQEKDWVYAQHLGYGDWIPGGSGLEEDCGWIPEFVIHSSAKVCDTYTKGSSVY